MSIKALYKIPYLITYIKRIRLECFGHVMRMDQTVVTKKVFEGKPEGIREVGTPILRWLEAEENDLRELKLKRWRQKANNKEQRVSAAKETTDFR
jgi:hypothetical protein